MHSNTQVSIAFAKCMPTLGADVPAKAGIVSAQRTPRSRKLLWFLDLLRWMQALPHLSSSSRA